ncbi:hypothetical protein KUTeg_020739 [Tegillarca granosa]|uniref:Uncharacterized protein n=1 Tax=Tegillarca granosa TaxID=220873 RepID=A0ABQ9EDX6_TEGGR|nr:hypothetical protein KUTeg_020739 [Tegillarca granosa]
MYPRKRGRYQVFLADKSIPTPKVSLWRMQRESDNSSLKNGPPEDVDNRCETDDPGAIIDAFHEKSFNQQSNIFKIEAENQASCLSYLLFQDVPDVPELSEWANPHGPDPDEEFDVFNSEFEDMKCDIDRNGDSDTVEADKPLYAGATITLPASMVLVISFAMRHSLTGEALADLLVLLDLHCLTPNLCMKSIKTFMDLFRNFKAPLQFHYYCEQCLLYHGTVKQNFCRNCQTTIKRNSNAYFLVIPIISQLSSLFADGTLLKQIWEYKASQSKKDDGMISDIMDGKLYQERFRKDGYFKGSTSQDLGDLHISLQINTDGVSLFHSSTFSIWPIYFIINELPPHLRFTRSNRIFAGMWFGYSKPDFSTFLKPFAESLHEIYHAVWVGGYCIKSLSESVALSLRALLGDPCPQLQPLQPPSDSTVESVLNVIKALRPYWKCFQFQGNLQPDETPLMPALLDWPPITDMEFYTEHTRPRRYSLSQDCYDKDYNLVADHLDNRIDSIIAETSLKKAPNKLPAKLM